MRSQRGRVVQDLISRTSGDKGREIVDEDDRSVELADGLQVGQGKERDVDELVPAICVVKSDSHHFARFAAAVEFADLADRVVLRAPSPRG